MTEINDANFEKEVVEASKAKAVIVDFFAEWCGTCKLMAPIIEELAGELAAQAAVVKANIEEAPLAAEKYGVLSLPTIILFQNGEVKKTLTGPQAKENILELLEN